ADADDFQLELQPPASPPPYGAGSILTYTLIYGSYLAQPTDVIVLQVSWSQGQSEQACNTVADSLEYVNGSASPALGKAEPVVALVGRTITWQTSPVPPATNRPVSWQLRTTSNPHLTSPFLFPISAKL